MREEQGMTRDQKIEWLANASNEEVLERIRWAVVAIYKADSIAAQVEGQEDYDLVMAEIRRRMEK